MQNVILNINCPAIIVGIKSQYSCSGNCRFFSQKCPGLVCTRNTFAQNSSALWKPHSMSAAWRGKYWYLNTVISISSFIPVQWERLSVIPMSPVQNEFLLNELMLPVIWNCGTWGVLSQEITISAIANVLLVTTIASWHLLFTFMFCEKTISVSSSFKVKYKRNSSFWYLSWILPF